MYAVVFCGLKSDGEVMVTEDIWIFEIYGVNGIYIVTYLLVLLFQMKK